MATVSLCTKDARFAFIEAEGDRIGVSWLCRRLGVSRSGYYAWKASPMSRHDLEDQQLLARIRSIFDESGGTYGVPRVHHGLVREGRHHSTKRVHRLMRFDGMRARAAKIYRRTPRTHWFFCRSKNEVLKVVTSGPNQVLVGDITFLTLNGRRRYLAVVLDRHSRRVLGAAYGARKTAELTEAALERALAARDPNAWTIFHSDRGSEYAAYSYAAKLGEANILQSANRPMHMNDNAEMESFWHTLKSEMYHGAKFKNDAELLEAIQRVIHRYNTQRFHSSLNYMSPIEYEQRAASAA